MIKRQRTIVGRLQRDIERKAAGLPITACAREILHTTLVRAAQLVAQSGTWKTTKDQPKLYRFHAPEVSCINDLGYRGVEHDNPELRIIHRGKSKRITGQERQLLKRRQAIEPIISHLKSDHRMDCCHDGVRPPPAGVR